MAPGMYRDLLQTPEDFARTSDEYQGILLQSLWFCQELFDRLTRVSSPLQEASLDNALDV